MPSLPYQEAWAHWKRSFIFPIGPNCIFIGKTIGEKLQVSTMSNQMNTMFNHADAFIALPGGLGTLEEIFHIFSWA